MKRIIGIILCLICIGGVIYLKLPWWIALAPLVGIVISWANQYR